LPPGERCCRKVGKKGKKSIVRCIIEKKRGAKTSSDKHRPFVGLAEMGVVGGTGAIAKITKDNAGVATSRRDVGN